MSIAAEPSSSLHTTNYHSFPYNQKGAALSEVSSPYTSL